jgi:hypothetical protein
MGAAVSKIEVVKKERGRRRRTHRHGRKALVLEHEPRARVVCKHLGLLEQPDPDDERPVGELQLQAELLNVDDLQSWNAGGEANS